MAGEAPGGALELVVKHGAADVRVTLAAGSTVADLKQQLEAATGLFARQQKLIHKGRVLDDSRATLEACKLASGARLMLLGSQGLPTKGQPVARAALPPRKPVAPAAPKAAAGAGAGASGSGSSSLLADKMAGMAAANAAKAGASKVVGMAERRAGWAKSGVISLRDMQLADVPPEMLEGLQGARAADLSHNSLAVLPASVSQLTGLASLKLAHNRLTDGGVPWGALAGGLGGLTSLMLGHNQLTALPSCVGQLSGLVSLGLQANMLTELQGLAGLTRLEVLELQDNLLEQLPDSIGSCSSLVALNASNNSLTALPDALATLGKLQVLAVDNNRLSALPAQLLAGCSSLCTLSAHHNPLTVEHLRSAAGYDEYNKRRQTRATKQIEGRVLASIDRAFSEGADVPQWARRASGPAGLGRDGSGRAPNKPQ